MKVLKVFYYVISTAILMWFIISFADIVLHNGSVNPVYQPWNAFSLMVEWGQ